jgi:hypothetical protein
VAAQDGQPILKNPESKRDYRHSPDKEVTVAHGIQIEGGEKNGSKNNTIWNGVEGTPWRLCRAG